MKDYFLGHWITCVNSFSPKLGFALRILFSVLLTDFCLATTSFFLINEMM